MTKQSSKSGGPHGPNVWVGPHANGWQVKREGNERASRVTPTKEEAKSIGRQYAREAHSELILQGQNGKIQDKDSHGHESTRPDKDGHRAR